MVIATKRRLAGYAGVLALVSSLSVMACNAVLGIGGASVDPLLDDAGSGGDAGPGNNCATYCSLIEQNCTGTSAEYISDAVCQSMCSTFEPGTAGDMTQDTLACRISHAQQAATDPLTHCQKAGPLSPEGCADPCHSFCVLAFGLCNPTMLFPYDGGTKSCETACAGYHYELSTDGGAGVGDILFLSGDTLNCRLYHLESAYAYDPTTNPAPSPSTAPTPRPTAPRATDPHLEAPMLRR